LADESAKAIVPQPKQQVVPQKQYSHQTSPSPVPVRHSVNLQHYPQHMAPVIKPSQTPPPLQPPKKILKIRSQGDKYYDRIMLYTPSIEALKHKILEKKKMRNHDIDLIIELPNVRIRDDEDVLVLSDDAELEITFKLKPEGTQSKYEPSKGAMLRHQQNSSPPSMFTVGSTDKPSPEIPEAPKTSVPPHEVVPPLIPIQALRHSQHEVIPPPETPTEIPKPKVVLDSQSKNGTQKKEPPIIHSKSQQEAFQRHQDSTIINKWIDLNNYNDSTL